VRLDAADRARKPIVDRRRVVDRAGQHADRAVSHLMQVINRNLERSGIVERNAGSER